MADLKSEFEKWITAGNTKKQDAIFCVSNLLEVSAYALSKSITKVGIFEIVDRDQFNNLRSKLLGNKVFRINNKSTFRAFEKTGKNYSDFLKQYRAEAKTEEKSVVDIETVALVDQCDKDRNGNERTIVQAIVEVLNETSPLTPPEIYKKIVEKDLYRFGAKVPCGVVLTELMRHCENQEIYTITSKSKFFKIIGERENSKLFALAIDNNLTEKNGEKVVKKERDVYSTPDLNWNEQIAADFQEWIIKLGKAEATARSYRSAMNFVVRTFSNEWATAKKQTNAILGIKCFYGLIKANKNFIASNKVMHNAYSASIKAFYLFLSKDKENLVPKKQRDEMDSAEKIWDWKGDNDSEDAKPVMVRTKLDGEVPVKSWRDALRYLYEYVLNYYPAVDLVSQKLCSSDSVGMLRPWKLTNGLFIETNYSTKDIMAKCKRLILSCGENLSNVELIFQKKNDKQIATTIGSEEIHVPKTHTFTEQEQRVILLFINNFVRGIRLQFRDLMILKQTYESKHGESLTLTDDEISNIIKQNGFETEPNKFIHIDNLLCGITVAEIEKLIAEQNEIGAKRIWIEPLYNHFRGGLGLSMSADLLVQIIFKHGKQKYRKDGYYNYIVYNSATLDGQRDEMHVAIANLLMREGTHLTLNEIQQKLPFYPSIIEKKGVYPTNHLCVIGLPDGSFAHTNCVYLTDEEIVKIKNIIEALMAETGAIERERVIEKLKEDMPSIFENNEVFGITGTWAAIVVRLINDFSFGWQIKRRKG